MTETQLPKTPEEMRALLEAAIEYGRQEGPRETEAPRDSKVQLKVQLNSDIASLKADRRKSPARLRALQAKYQEMGLAWEDVDLTPPRLAPGRTIHDWYPPGQ